MTHLLRPAAPGIQLRPYQLDGITRTLAAIGRGKKAPLMVSPTGTGKMVLAAEILRRASAKGNTALFAVHRREMVKQCSEKLDAMGVSHGVILPGHKPGNMHTTYVGTVQSYRARLARGTFDPLNVRVIVIDEAHHATAATYRALREQFPNAVCVGLTATPIRADGTGLGNVFDELVQCITYSDALKQGHLVQPRYYAPTTPDLSGVTVRAGDYAEDELEQVMNKPQLVGDIVQHYARHAADRQGIVFATRVRHSIALAEEFTRAGFSAFHIDGTTPTEERDEYMEAFRAGELQVMVNVGVGTEGFDVPNVGAVVVARPTQSVGLHMQMVGRALRPAPGKADCLVLDHAGNTVRLGPVEQYEHWELDSNKGKKGKKKKKEHDPKEITCEVCSAVFYASKVCPACGHVHAIERAPLDLDVADGELVELGKKKSELTLAEKQAWYRMLLAFADANGIKPGWAYHAYHRRFGVYPKWSQQEMRLRPSAEVLAWAQKERKRQRIAYAKSKAKEEGTRQPTPTLTNPDYRHPGERKSA